MKYLELHDSCGGIHLSDILEFSGQNVKIWIAPAEGRRYNFYSEL
jgi:hypothetical protein